MYGAQTKRFDFKIIQLFENDVEMYGAQTREKFGFSSDQFENDVEMYGAQTTSTPKNLAQSLRMMQKCMVLKHLQYLF